MNWRTSSNLERVEICPGSVVIPGYSHSGVESAQGTRNHDKAERGDLPPRLKTLTLECSNAEREVSFVLDVKKRAVVRSSPRARDYGELADWELGTTPDFFGELAQLRAWRVRDWKSRKIVTTPKQNPQIISQALAIFAAKGAAIVDAGLGYLANDQDDPYTFTVFDVPDMWRRLELILTLGHRAKPEQIHESEQCTYCHCLTTCPAKRAALVQLGVEMPTDLDHMPAEKIGQMHNMIVSLEKIIDRAKELVKARARREPIPVGGGKVLQLVESSRRSLDQDRMRAFIEESGADVKEFEKVTTYMQLREVRVK